MNEPFEVSPDHYKLMFENDEVRVIQASWKPGERDEMHSHPHNFLIYALTDVKLNVQQPDGETKIMEMEGGSVNPTDPVELHSAQNIGNSEARVLLIDLK